MVVLSVLGIVFLVGAFLDLRAGKFDLYRPHMSPITFITVAKIMVGVTLFMLGAQSHD